MSTILLIRHAKPENCGLLLGQLDPPLAGSPIMPAAWRPSTLFVSPLLRARQTAAALFPKESAIILPELMEANLGDWQGLTWAQVEAKWPTLAKTKLADWRAHNPPNAEDWGDFESRVQRAWQQIKVAQGPVAVVAHAGVNALLYQFGTGTDALTVKQNHEEVLSFETD